MNNHPPPVFHHWPILDTFAGGILAAAPFIVHVLQGVSLLASVIASVCGAIIGVAGVRRLRRIRRFRHYDR